jgi:hypothetical protein
MVRTAGSVTFMSVVGPDPGITRRVLPAARRPPATARSNAHHNLVRQSVNQQSADRPIAHGDIVRTCWSVGMRKSPGVASHEYPPAATSTCPSTPCGGFGLGDFRFR